MDFLYNDDEEDDNFDHFITQHLQTPLRNRTIENKKQLITLSPKNNPFTQLTLNQDSNIKSNIGIDVWELFMKKMNLDEHLQIHDQYPMNKFNIKKINQGLYDNIKMPELVCELKQIEEFGQTASCILKDQTDQCQASILSKFIKTDFEDEGDEGDEDVKIYMPVHYINKKDNILIYLENVTVFAPNDYQKCVIIGESNIKMCIF